MVGEDRVKPPNRTGQVWEDKDPGSDPDVQMFLVVGPSWLEDLDYVHPIFNFDTGKRDTWYEFHEMPWEDEYDIERLG